MMRSKKGFTLIEVLIGITVFLVFCIGIFYFFFYGQKEIDFTTHSYQAEELANQKLEEIKTMPYRDIENSQEILTIDGIRYRRKVVVNERGDIRMKEVKVEVSWTEGGERYKIELNTIVAPR